jgi:cytochrome c biogenesis protein CcmG/thiol:disulfide interchange protein DsbE
MSDATPVEGQPARPRRLLVLAPLLIFAALAVVFAVQLFAGPPSRLPSTLIGAPVPDVTLPALPGLQVQGAPVPGLSRASLSDGQVTLVNVFASWCPPCHLEHPHLMALAAEGTVRIVGINQKDQTENALRFLAQKGNPYSAVGVDANGRASIEWGVYGVPETFIVRGDGTIAHKFVGPLTPDAIEREIRPAIRAAGGRA